MTDSRIRTWLRYGTLELVLVVACIWLHFASEDFSSGDNLLAVLRNAAEIGIIAFGMTMVIIAGEIDLSVGSAVAFAGCLCAILVKGGVPTPGAILATLAAGFAAGAFIGIVRARWGVPSFITSLALLTGLRGLAHELTGGFSLSPFPEWFAFLGSGHLFGASGVAGGAFPGIPVPVLIFLLVFAAVSFVMSRTTFGRAVYAVGGNAETARLCGINVGRVRVLVLALTGLLAALSGLILASRMSSGIPTVARGLELDVIAAVIVGGTSLSGGVGRVWGTLVGVLLIGVISNGMTLLDVQEEGQLIARGVIILLAVLFSRLQQPKS